MDFYNAARLTYKIERLPQRLDKILSDLPPLLGQHPALEHEYSALFGFVKRVERLAEHVVSSKTPGGSEDKNKQALIRACNAVASRLAAQVATIQIDVDWSSDTRAFMLRESKKRVLQVVEDLRAERPRSVALLQRQLSISEASSGDSRHSEAVAISSSRPPHPTSQEAVGTRSRRQNMGAIIPIRQYSPNRNGIGPTSTPRVRDIVRVGSYQNAQLFSGSPVAVAYRKRFKEPVQIGSPRLTPPGTLRGKDYFSISHAVEAPP